MCTLIDNRLKAAQDKMSDRLTDTQMLKLVEIYRDYECLWNVRNTLYTNRDARECAYKSILERLNIPGLSLKDVPKKIKNLRSSYYQELKRIEKSTQSGAGEPVYKPKVSWFRTADGFLQMFRKNPNTFSNVTNTQSTNSSEDHDAEESSNQETYSDINVAEPAEEEENIEEFEDETNFTTLTNTTITMRSEQNNFSTGFWIQDSQDIHEGVADIDSVGSTVTRIPTLLVERHEDEFDAFGKYIATSLRSLPKELGIVAKTDIQTAISEVQLKALSPEMPETEFTLIV